MWSRGLLCAGTLMIPWSGCLLRRLPRDATVARWNVAWAGLDVLEAAGLAGAGFLLGRGDERYRLCAAATAALLVTDAWFDVVTSQGGQQRAAATAMAAAAELPAAALCAALAARDLRTAPPAAGERVDGERAVKQAAATDWSAPPRRAGRPTPLRAVAGEQPATAR